MLTVKIVIMMLDICIGNEGWWWKGANDEWQGLGQHSWCLQVQLCVRSTSCKVLAAAAHWGAWLGAQQLCSLLTGHHLPAGLHAAHLLARGPEGILRSHESKEWFWICIYVVDFFPFNLFCLEFLFSLSLFIYIGFTFLTIFGIKFWMY